MARPDRINIDVYIDNQIYIFRKIDVSLSSLYFVVIFVFGFQLSILVILAGSIFFV